MRSRSNWAMAGMLLCRLFWPCMKLITHYSPYEFYLHSELFYLLLMSLISMGLFLYLVQRDELPVKWLCLIPLPVSIVSGTLEVLFFRTVFAIPLSLLNCIWAGILFSRCLPDRWYKYLTAVACVLLVIAYGYMCWLCLIFGQIGTQRIVEEVPSPNNEKLAQLMDDNQGALGGNTFVYIRYRDLLPLGFGGIRPDSKMVYRGSWGSFETIRLHWQDDHTLLINDAPHTVP